MGSSGSMLESGGFSAPNKWHTVGYIDGIKILQYKDGPKLKLPDRSNTPGTTYVLQRSDGSFYQLRKFKDDRSPEYDIDYGKHKNQISLHVHYYDAKGGRKNTVEYLTKDHPLYLKYQEILKGVPLK